MLPYENKRMPRGSDCTGVKEWWARIRRGRVHEWRSSGREGVVRQGGKEWWEETEDSGFRGEGHS